LHQVRGFSTLRLLQRAAHFREGNSKSAGGRGDTLGNERNANAALASEVYTERFERILRSSQLDFEVQ
jgi:hypothetical protein